MAGLKAEGVKVGLTLSGPRQAEVLERALEVEVDGLPLFDTVQATFNLLEQSVAPMLEEASRRGLGIIVKEGLANGRLTARNQDPELAEAVGALRAVAQARGVGEDAVALAFVLAQPWAQVVLSGAAVENHLRSNLDALKLNLSPEEMNSLEGHAMNVEAYWASRAEMTWN